MDAPTDDYSNGQMMGMLCLIRMLKTKGTIPAQTIDRIERMATVSLSEYLQKPEEDVLLLVDSQLEGI